MLAASVGSERGPTIVLHGHLDVVPGHEEQFEPRTDGDRILGRGAYDMKGALAGMMGALEELRNEDAVRVVLAIVPDEESEEEIDRGTAFLIQNGFTGDFAITGEPTDLHVGVQAKGVLAMRLKVGGTAAHGATPWLGEPPARGIAGGVERLLEVEQLGHGGAMLDARRAAGSGRDWHFCCYARFRQWTRRHVTGAASWPLARSSLRSAWPERSQPASPIARITARRRSSAWRW